MPVCYGCLYEYREEDVGGEGGEDALALVGASCGSTADLGVVPAAVSGHDLPGLFLRSASVDLWSPVGEGGVTMGRDPANDVVLHSPAVSRAHLRLVPTPDGMEVSDLGSTNPASYHGRPLSGCVVVPYGDVIEVCGTIVTMTGPSSIVSSGS